MELAEPIGRMVSPLSLDPQVPMPGHFMYAGVADQLVHPRAQVVRLWEHWGKPQIVWYPGGHTGFFRSRPVQRFGWGYGPTIRAPARPIDATRAPCVVSEVGIIRCRELRKSEHEAPVRSGRHQ